MSTNDLSAIRVRRRRAVTVGAPCGALWRTMGWVVVAGALSLLGTSGLQAQGVYATPVAEVKPVMPVTPVTPATQTTPVTPATQTTTATQATQVDGFGVTYTAPAKWTLSGRQGRIHAWTNATQTAALVVYGGHFSSLELAMGDAQRALGVPREEDLRIITPLAPTRIGTFSGIAGSVRVTGASPVVAHVAAAQLNDSTVLGAVVVLDAAAADSTLALATQEVAELLAGARIAEPRTDSALAARLTGKWAVSTAYTSSPTGGGYSNDESWTFAADGTFAYSKRFAVSMPGGNITPEERDDSGRWYAVGGAIVLVSDEGRLTVDVQVDVQVDDATLLLDGTTFTRQ